MKANDGVIGDFMTLCDSCGAEISQEEASDGIGEYDGGTLCSECYALELFRIQDKEKDEAVAEKDMGGGG